MITVCGQEFAFSALNASDLERLDAAQQHLKQRSTEDAARFKGASMAEILRSQCRQIMDFLDEVLGVGASQRLGLDGNNLGECAQMVYQISQAIREQQSLAPKAGLVHTGALNIQLAPPSKAARRQELLAQLAALEND